MADRLRSSCHYLRVDLLSWSGLNGQDQPSVHSVTSPSRLNERRGSRRSQRYSARCAKRSASSVAYYLDTSGAVKLVLDEPGSDALSGWAAAHADDVVSSDLLRTELLRATRRGAPEHMQRAREVLDSVMLLALPSATFQRAAELDPPLLRSLDALHLATALELGDELDGVVSYDVRLSAAAEQFGVVVIAPA